MLSQETAEKRLGEFKVEDGLARRLAEVRALPDPLRRLAGDLVGRSRAGDKNKDRQQRWRAQVAAAAEIDTLPEHKRLRIFGALFGGLDHYADAAWQALRNAPYQTSDNRRPFRAPGYPDVHAPRQAVWAAGLFETTASYEQDIIWWAEWAGYLPAWQHGVAELGWLFAGAINCGGTESQESMLRSRPLLQANTPSE